MSSSPSSSLFSRVVVATDLEPDDVAMLYTLCASAARECESPSITVLLGEGSPDVKRAVWGQVRVALLKVFPGVSLFACGSHVQSAVEYDLEALDAAFNFAEGQLCLPKPRTPDITSVWSEILAHAPSLVIFTRPLREWLQVEGAVERFPITQAPL